MKANRDNHNVLIIVFENGDTVNFSYPFSTQKDEAVRKAFSCGEFKEENVRKIIWIDETSENLSMYSDYYNIESKEINYIKHAVAEKNKQIRTSRNVIMQKLDIEMIKLLERDESCEPCRKHFTKFKNYLRDLPSLMEDYNFTSPRQVMYFNPYDNVFDVYINNAGSGYTSPPTIEIEAPNGHPLKKGFQLKAEAEVEDGSISKVTVTQIGSSYVSKPKVTVSAPDEEGGEQAELEASMPENNAELPPLTK